jgi:DNA topoisomerase-1
MDNDTIKLDFLGKDSIRYCRKVKVDEVCYNNIKSFINNKNKKEDLFDKISSASLNNYLDNLMEGLKKRDSIDFVRNLQDNMQGEMSQLPKFQQFVSKVIDARRRAIGLVK